MTILLFSFLLALTGNVEAGNNKLKEASEKLCRGKGSAIGIVSPEPGQYFVICESGDEEMNHVPISESEVLSGLARREITMAVLGLPE